MRDLFRLANDIQSFCRERGWKFCFIGGLALQRWGGATPHRGRGSHHPYRVRRRDGDYNGEGDLGSMNRSNAFAYLWVDQDLKRELGF